MRRVALLPLLALPLTLTGCGEQGILAEVWNAHLQDLILATLGYGVAGAVAGSVVGLVAYFVLRKLGAYDGEWRFAGIARALTAILLVIAGGFCGGGVGTCVGIVKGSEATLRKGQLGTQVFPQVASTMADFTYVLAVGCQRVDEQKQGKRDEAEDPWDIGDDELELFRTGKSDLEAAQLTLLHQQLTAEGSQQVVTSFTDKVFGEVKEEEKSSSRVLTEQCCGYVVEYMAAREAKKKAGKGIMLILARSFDFAAAAKRSDPGERLAHQELRDHYVDQLIVPVCVLTVEKSVKGYRLLFVLGLIAAPLLPILFFWPMRKVFPASAEEGEAPRGQPVEGPAAAPIEPLVEPQDPPAEA